MLPEIKISNLRRYMDSIINAMKEHNTTVDGWGKLDIPYLVSSLYQSFANENELDKYGTLIQDLIHNDYCSVVVNDDIDDYTLCKVCTYFMNPLQNNPYNNGYLPMKYIITFYDDMQYLGYCECTPDMPDYRPDKKCCGHGCDATFCRFEIERVEDIHSGTWHGDEHDYWDFEDAFYENDKELAEEKKTSEKAQKEEYLRREIESLQKELEELRNG